MIAAHHVKTEFAYWTRPESPDPLEAASMINGLHPGMKRFPTEVQDIRESSIKFNLDDYAFRVIKHNSAFLPPTRDDFDFSDGQQIRNEYWPELHEVVKSNLGARCVVCLDSVARTSSDERHPEFYEKDGHSPLVNGQRAPRPSGQPFHIVHNDFSPIGCRNLLRAFKPSFFEENSCSTSVAVEDQQQFFELRDEILDAEKTAIKISGALDHVQWNGANYEGPRWGHFSIWRPLEMVEKDPLGLLDPSSLFTVGGDYAEKRKSYVSIPFPHRDRRGMEDYEGPNIMPVPPPPGQQHQWYWMRQQKPDEIYAIKIFDSEAWKQGSHVMPCGAHSAFKLPDQSDKPPRRSIETRCLVIW